MKNVLVVCVGNICRSPLAEAMLRSKAPNIKVSSAGIGAVVGQGADVNVANLAKKGGFDVSGHIARQVTESMSVEAELILTMEPIHRSELARMVPFAAGKTMLLSHWSGGQAIPDPYKRSRELHQLVYEMIDEETTAWAQKLL